MKRTLKHIAWSSALLLLTATACQDSWNQHYTYNKSLGGEDLLTTLKAEASYSRFVKLIEIAGLEEKLSGSGSFTVWAPHNDFIPDSVYTSSDTSFIRDIVHNHIAYFLHSTAKAYSGSSVMMLNGKYIAFGKLGKDDFVFGGFELDAADQVCSNGVLHGLGGYVPFEYNLWEYLEKLPELSMLLQAYNFYDSTYMDRVRSKRIGVDSLGNHVYDTVLIQENTLLRRIGKIYSEEQKYTMIAPSNQAFEKAFDYYKDFFKSNGGPTVVMDRDSIQRTRTHLAMIKNLIFKGSYETLTDSVLVSTFGYRFSNPEELFAGRHIHTSNGDLFVVDSLRFDPYELVYREIVYEVEKVCTPEDVTTANYMLLYPGENTKIQGISGGYLYLIENSASRDPKLTVNLGDSILSAKYDIYFTIVPGNTEDSTNVNEQTLLDFSMSYKNGHFARNINLNRGQETLPTELHLIQAGSEVNIPTFDSEVSLSLTVKVPSSKRDLYKRNVRIDNVRLVPAGKNPNF